MSLSDVSGRDGELTIVPESYKTDKISAGALGETDLRCYRPTCACACHFSLLFWNGLSNHGINV